MGAKIDKKSNFFVEIVPKRFQDAPRRSQDAPKMRQDAPRTAQDRPEVVPGRLQDAPDAPRRLQDGPKRRPRRPKTPTDPRKKKAQKRSEAQSPPDLVFGTFLGGFWEVFGWIRDGFGDDFGSLGVDF